MSADSKSPMLNGGTPPKDLEEDVKFTEEDSRRNHVVECWVVLLIVINIVLAVIVIVLAAPTQTDPDPSQCNEWKNNRSASFSELLKQITDVEVNRPQFHYLGWGRNFDPDAGTPLETIERSEQAHFTSHIQCPEKDPQNTDDFETLCWNQSCPNTFCNSPLKYEFGKIRVHRAGYFFIYSRLLFDVTNLKEEWMSLTHDIMRQSGNRSHMKILETRNVVTEPRKDKVRSYLGAAFYLYGGDRISVRVNTRSRSYLSNEDIYFGMFRI